MKSVSGLNKHIWRRPVAFYRKWLANFVSQFHNGIYQDLDCQPFQLTLTNMNLTPTIAIHMTAAIAATAIGPFAIWARLGAHKRPKLHRAAGYAWVTLMVLTALSALFIRDNRLPNIYGYTPIHLLIPYTLFGLFGAFYHLAKGNIVKHKKIMLGLYVGACLIAGAFTLLPNRYLGGLLWAAL